MWVLKACAVWLLILVCAVLNGALREGWLVPHLGSVAAFVTSGLILSMCILAAALLLVTWMGAPGAGRYGLVGLLWLGLTLAFEFGFGLFVQQRTWQQLLGAYTFEGGNLWPLVLAVTFFAPLLAARLRGLLVRPVR
jgi:hypothetical protein